MVVSDLAMPVDADASNAGGDMPGDMALNDLAKKSCGYSLSEPWAISGGRIVGMSDAGNPIINTPSCDAEVTTFAIWAHVQLGNYPTGDEVYLVIDRTHKVGETFMPQMAVKYPSSPCSDWTGGLTLDRDVPFWKVSVNLQCASDPAVKWVGWIEGNQNAH